jgi:hypothetical protein
MYIRTYVVDVVQVMYAISRSSVSFGGIFLGIEQLYEQMSDGLALGCWTRKRNRKRSTQYCRLDVSVSLTNDVNVILGSIAADRRPAVESGWLKCSPIAKSNIRIFTVRWGTWRAVLRFELNVYIT